MATGKGVIQGYAAQAAVDSEHHIIVAAEVIGAGSEQAMLLPMGLVPEWASLRGKHATRQADPPTTTPKRKRSDDDPKTHTPSPAGG